MSMTIPTIPAMPAGYVATATDMNDLAYAAQFLLNRPIARMHDAAGGVAIGTGWTQVTFGTVDFDPDGMWASGVPNRLTVQTPGFYAVTYFVSMFTSGTTINVNTTAQVSTGSNNPAGSGINNYCWPGYGAGSAGGNRIYGRATGVIPFYMYNGDNVTVWAQAASAGLSTSNGFTPSSLSLELVSI